MKFPMRYSFAPVLMILSQSACMTDLTSENCNVAGAELLGGQMTSEEICSRFAQRLGAARQADGQGEITDISLSVKKPATIDVVVVLKSQDGSKSYPPVSIDAIDRQLVASDLDRLAEATAQVIAKDAGRASDN